MTSFFIFLGLESSSGGSDIVKDGIESGKYKRGTMKISYQSLPILAKMGLIVYLFCPQEINIHSQYQQHLSQIGSLENSAGRNFPSKVS